MAGPLLYLDECVDQRVAPPRRARGMQVTSVLDAGTLGDDDADQLAYAAQRDLLLLSHNRRDFRRLHALYQQQGRSHGGIALLPAGTPELLVLRIAMMVDWITTFPDHRSQLFRWHDLQYWLTQGNRLPDYDPTETRRALGQES